VPLGYAEAFLAVQKKWRHALNCWSASSSLPARVLSNWYPIAEGIPLYGATYDSTEHFWQAVKFHPDVTVSDLDHLLGDLQQKDWAPWIARLDGDPDLYLPNSYAVEFLRHNLAPGRLRWFREELGKHGLQPGERARHAQQRGSTSSTPFRCRRIPSARPWPHATLMASTSTAAASASSARSSVHSCWKSGV